MRASLLLRAAAALALGQSRVGALNLNTNDTDSIKAAASALVPYIVNAFHDKTAFPGALPAPYYRWESALALNGLDNYLTLTGEDSATQGVGLRLMTQSSLFIQGPGVGSYDYIPANQTSPEGNDDQGFWALAAMSAAETGFVLPDSAGGFQWIDAPRAVFDDQVARWDTKTCGGGLRWQIFAFNAGYNYKNSVAQGTFFQLAARLARYDGNQTYADWAERIWDWTSAVGLISKIPDSYQIFDGTSTTENCSAINHLQWSENVGLFLYGSAVMYNITGSPTWKARTNGLLNATSVFFNDANIMYEVACQPAGTCNTDQRAFRAILARAMADTARMYPAAASFIFPKLAASAAGAAAACSNGTDGVVVCGSDWTSFTSNGQLTGVGEQLSALEVIQGLLVPGSPPLGGASSLNATPALQASSSVSATLMASTPSSSAPAASTPSPTYGLFATITDGGAGSNATTTVPTTTVPATAVTTSANGTRTGVTSPPVYTGAAATIGSRWSPLGAAVLLALFV